MKDCIFCKILSGEAEARFVYRDENCSVFLDIQPLNPGHVLVVPNVHIERMADMPEALAGKIFEVATKVFKAILKTEIKCDGANFFLSDGSQAGQEVLHCHLHIAPRFSNDGVKVGFSKERQLKISASTQDEISQAVRDALMTSQ